MTVPLTIARHARTRTFDMILIPVMDVMHGQAVHAVRGDRQSYRPVESRLCTGSSPVRVADALCAHCASQLLYVADLDALLGRATQVSVLRSLLRALPHTEIWIDAGFPSADAASALLGCLGDKGARVVPVFGSESLASRAQLQHVFSGQAWAGSATARSAVLSLDRRDGRRLDAAGCWDAPELWPQRVIVMTLERVGADAGPDLETLQDVKRRAPSTFAIGAGGIRNEDDLVRAGQAGASAWLVASALHDGRLAPVRG